ncbi:hypothetical protein DFH05DRAFT_1528501 [Lentinula detonsa]|uniref:Uncharacterized protein n=1 Tax=Lentinula detonsa TaxID=2804962 RepID=A0A9W8NTQ4_9AGAR|nr:hypothetical protein DFH05DRAFT_1528501 [Lentinula detonsa]
MSFALPPGLYEIHTLSDDRKKLLAPSSPGEKVTIGTIKDPRSVWQISGDGLITSFSTGCQTQTMNSPSTAGSDVVTDKGLGMRWIVCSVESNGNYTWTGSIMTNDVTGLFWSIESGYKVVLASPNFECIPQFRFVAVSLKTSINTDISVRPTIGRGTLEAILTLTILILYKILERLGGKAKLA